MVDTNLDLNIDIAGAQIIPVEGKGQFPVITKLFRLIHKDVAILTDLDGFIETWKNTRIILSKRSSIATEGGIKMWRYTELNSGVEFTACLYRDNTIEIGMTDEGASRAYSLYVEQYENAFMDELDKFNQIVEKKKEKAEYEADVITSMLGAALFGALF